MHYFQDPTAIPIKAEDIPRRIVKQNDKVNQHSALLDESTWVCTECGNVVTEEKDHNGAIIPHPACEICFKWFHIDCVKLNPQSLNDKKMIFLCEQHSESGMFIVRAKKGWKY